MLRFLHAADFHLDSPFAGLPPRLAAQRRRELRELPKRFADYEGAGHRPGAPCRRPL